LVRALKRVDLPTLGRPTIPMVRLTVVEVTCRRTAARPRTPHPVGMRGLQFLARDADD
jgi:hypothetical protein